MMKKIFSLALFGFVGLTLFITGCEKSAESAPRSSKTPVLGPEQTAKPVDFPVGYIFKIRLAANPTTGYEWGSVPEMKGQSVRYIKSVYEQDADTGDKRVGAGGNRIWTFQAIQPGTTTLRFEYKQPWVENKAPAEIETFTIVVAVDPMEQDLLAENTSLI